MQYAQDHVQCQIFPKATDKQFRRAIRQGRDIRNQTGNLQDLTPRKLKGFARKTKNWIDNHCSEIPGQDQRIRIRANDGSETTVDKAHIDHLKNLYQVVRNRFEEYTLAGINRADRAQRVKNAVEAYLQYAQEYVTFQIFPDDPHCVEQQQTMIKQINDVEGKFNRLNSHSDRKKYLERLEKFYPESAGHSAPALDYRDALLNGRDTPRNDYFTGVLTDLKSKAAAALDVPLETFEEHDSQAEDTNREQRQLMEKQMKQLQNVNKIIDTLLAQIPDEVVKCRIIANLRTARGDASRYESDALSAEPDTERFSAILTRLQVDAVTAFGLPPSSETFEEHDSRVEEQDLQHARDMTDPQVDETIRYQIQMISTIKARANVRTRQVDVLQTIFGQGFGMALATEYQMDLAAGTRYPDDAYFRDLLAKLGEDSDNVLGNAHRTQGS